ncbi:MAG: class I SAM-dependent methyltransferase [Candidatus Omnitrophota bacterium]
MDAAYWNAKAGVYEEEIFNVWLRDLDGVLRKFFDDESFRLKTVIDCGCGIGHGIPTLSKCFKNVYAVDISRECLAVSRERYGSLPNVEFRFEDLARPRAGLPAADCIVSVNVLIMPSLSARLKILKVMRACLKSNGRMVLVVPSLESYYYAAYKLTEWKLREEVLGRSGFSSGAFQKGHGVVPIDGVMTKHYLKEELLSFLKLVGFEVLGIQKIRYGWETEYEDPPKWMQAPYPWDWMVVAKQQK